MLHRELLIPPPRALRRESTTVPVRAPSVDFIRHLEVEKRRAERSGSPLSIVLVRLQAPVHTAQAAVDGLVMQMRAAMRETDVVDVVGASQVAALLPDTSATGAQRFIERVRYHAGNVPLSIVTESYPDRLFDELVQATAAEEARTGVADLVPVRSKLDLAAKRVLDVAIGLGLIAAASPIMLATAIAIRCTSPGPIVFSQARIGKGGRPFRFYKFRSMRVNSDDRIHREYVSSLIRGEHERVNQQDASQPLYKIKADPRVTRVGAFIRRTSIDELPQLFNVLKGDMSLVGPRPPLPYEAAQYRSWHRRRILEIRPGITGLWQVEGRSKVSFDEMVRMDLRYIRDRSLLYDLRLLVKTVRVVLTGDGAK